MDNLEGSSISKADLLFLMTKLLGSFPGFENSAKAIKDDVKSSSDLGSSIQWNGTVKKFDVEDLERKYSNIPSNQLLLHLQNSLAHIGSSESYGMVPSLLHRFIGRYNPYNSSQCEKFSVFAHNIANHYERIHALQSRTRYLLHRSQNLKTDSKKCVDLLLEGGVEDENGIIDMSQDEGNIPAALKEIGRSKELTKIQHEIESNSTTLDLYNEDINELTSSLAKLGCLSGGVYRGHIDNTLGWLHARSLGLTGRAYRNGGSPSLGTNLIPSALSVQSRLTYQYRLHWTISGHMMNPAYCAVFDQTGQYIITGADDYLLKIWHVEKAQLVRTCKGHISYITIIEVSPDNSIIASACVLGTIRIWRMSDGLCLNVFHHRLAVNWLKFDPSSSCLASAGDDGLCIVWDLSKMVPRELVETPHFDLLKEDKYREGLLSYTLTVAASGGVTSGVVDLEPQGCYYKPRTEPSASSLTDCDANPIPTVTNSTASEESEVISNAGSAFPGLFKWSQRLSQLASSSSSSSVRRIASSGSAPGLPTVGLVHSSMLVLEHVQDTYAESQRSADEENKMKVLSLDICPLGNVLVTGCEDGVGRVWRFGDPPTFVTSSGYSTRGTTVKRPNDTALQMLKDALSPEQFERVERLNNHLLARLEGHVSPITDIHLSSLGDRVVTGSSQDGNVRIWSFGRDYTKIQHIVLDLNEEDAEMSQNFQSRFRGGARVRPNNKTQLYNVCWTSDDLHVITIQSVPSNPSESIIGTSSVKQITRLKLWESTTGDLLRVIWNVSDGPCNVLVRHPLDPRIVLTTGEDGLVNVWDINTESNLSNSRVLNNDGGPAHIVDASFSPDGTKIVCTDMLGRLSLLNIDQLRDGRDGNIIYTEQYFSTDYASMILDEQLNAIDEGTQMAVHEAPVGLLCRIDGKAYDEQPLPLRGPQPLTMNEMRVQLDKIIEDRKCASAVMDKNFMTFCRNKNRMRTPKKYSNSKSSSKRSGGSSSKNNGGGSSPKVNYKEFDLNNYVPSSDDSELDSDWDRHESTHPVVMNRVHRTRDTRHNASSSNTAGGGAGGGGVRGNIHSFRNRGGNGGSQLMSRGNIVSFSQDMLRRSSRSGRSRANYSLDDDNFDQNDYYVGSSGGASARAARALNRSLARSAERMDDDEYSFSSEDDDDVIHLDSDSDGGRHRPHRRRSSRVASNRSHRLRNHGGASSSSSAAAVIDVDAAEGALPRQSVPRVKKPIKIFWTHIPPGTVPFGVPVDRAWLQNDTVNECQYAPQLGDKVIYFPQGHAEALSYFPESSRPPWFSFANNKWPFVECEVRSLTYRMPNELEYNRCPSVLAELTLALVRTPNRYTFTPVGGYSIDFVEQRSTRNSSNKEHLFSVTLRSCHLPDFIIPSHKFLRSVHLPWHEGIRLNVLYKETNEVGDVAFKVYGGAVVSFANANQDWPSSPWDALEIRWDDASVSGGLEAAPSAGGVDRIGPWEASPIYDEASGYNQMLEKFVSPSLDQEFVVRVDQEITKLMEENVELYEAFQYPVDSELHPYYYNVVVVPMCVDLILSRLRSGYYRQLAALEYDISMIQENCVTFNLIDSALAKSSIELKNKLLDIINPERLSATQPSSSSASTGGEEMLVLKLNGKRRRPSTTQNESEDEDEEERGQQQQHHTQSHYSTRYGGRSHAEMEEAHVLRIKRARRDQYAEEEENHRLSQISSSSRSSRRVNITFSGYTEPHADTHGSRSSSRLSGRNTSAPPVAPSPPVRDMASINAFSNGRMSTRHSTASTAPPVASQPAVAHPYPSRRAQQSAPPPVPDVRPSFAPTGRTTRNSQHASAPEPAVVSRGMSSSSSSSARAASNSRSGRTRAAVRYADPDSDEDEDEESEANHDDDDDEESEQSEENDRRRRSTRSSHNASNNRQYSTSTRQASSGSSSRRSAPQQPERRSSRRQIASSEDSEDQSESDEDEEEEAPLTQSRSGRQVKPVQNFWESQHSTESATHHRKPKEEHRHEPPKTSMLDQSVNSRRIDPDLKKNLLEIVKKAEELDSEYGMFADPVDEDDAPSYYDIVLNPMCLSAIRSKIQTRQYNSLDAIKEDVFLMYDNCDLYNDAESIFCKEARKQRKNFRAFIKNFEEQLH